jgi:RNA-splicing ligase RtcB
MQVFLELARTERILGEERDGSGRLFEGCAKKAEARIKEAKEMKELGDTQKGLHFSQVQQADSEIDRRRKEAYGSHGVKVRLRVEYRKRRLDGR